MAHLDCCPGAGANTVPRRTVRAARLRSPIGASARRRAAQGSRGVADDRGVRGYVLGDHTARADQCAIADANARQDDLAAADPYIAADADRSAELETLPSQFWFARV